MDPCSHDVGPLRRKRGQGRPRLRWSDMFTREAGKQWSRTAKNRVLWKELGKVIITPLYDGKLRVVSVQMLYSDLYAPYCIGRCFRTHADRTASTETLCLLRQQPHAQTNTRRSTLVMGDRAKCFAKNAYNDIVYRYFYSYLHPYERYEMCSSRMKNVQAIIEASAGTTFTKQARSTNPDDDGKFSEFNLDFNSSAAFSRVKPDNFSDP
ncbi:hypothetical protein ANN_13168 [Periplaneta americana]|uniref:Uncharacterized protein n=1 Tax=Periplaneta americana TaxID=6978 RepID=A0ABQ8TJ23_PERAM|nr:hypothetical protein ANN_13168 [Periplaneta americana]